MTSCTQTPTQPAQNPTRNQSPTPTSTANSPARTATSATTPGNRSPSTCGAVTSVTSPSAVTSAPSPSSGWTFSNVIARTTSKPWTIAKTAPTPNDPASA
uniref:(northern house mosquito) hypothetical protein n=1 Tax=Culex pipiens TaxID=7175 RepID=A0A8D8KN23_CULPI